MFVDDAKLQPGGLGRPNLVILWAHEVVEVDRLGDIEDWRLPRGPKRDDTLRRECSDQPLRDLLASRRGASESRTERFEIPRFFEEALDQRRRSLLVEVPETVPPADEIPKPTRGAELLWIREHAARSSSKPRPWASGPLADGQGTFRRWPPSRALGTFVAPPAAVSLLAFIVLSVVGATDSLPPGGVSPLESPAETGVAASTPGASPAGATPLEPGSNSVGATTKPAEGARPLDGPHPPAGDPPASLPADATPFGVPPGPAPPPDPRTTLLLRVDALVGPVWRIRPLDTMVATDVEFGREQGLSGSFSTSLLVVTDRAFVQSLDAPIGVGALWRSKWPGRPLYASAGLSVGMLIHRAKIDGNVTHRVDPDFRLPLGLSWTIAGAGATLALVPGYSVRTRTYERRGSPVLQRDAVRIGLVLGLHWDFNVGRAESRRLFRR